MKQLLVISCLAVLALFGQAQSPASLMDEGKKLEQRMKDGEALEKYKQVLVIQPNHQKAQLKVAELLTAMGNREANPAGKAIRYREALMHAREGWLVDSADAEANYVMAMVYGKITEVEEKREALVDAVRQVKRFADKAVAADAGFGKGWHVLGKWHYEVVTLNGVKKAALKLLFGGLPPASMDSAIAYMEKCRSLEPYYTANFYDLGKAYQHSKKYAEAIGVLEQLAKLPSRRQADVEIKAEGAKLLQQLQ
ncbi:MAG TPA: hypothetical protein PKD90_05790 [Phnomibacter sp.]|nr:hypothetical protein [Phnomibacter sp.]